MVLRLYGYAVLRLYGCEVLRLCGRLVGETVVGDGYMVMWLYDCTVVEYGYTIVGYGYTVVRLYGFKVIWWGCGGRRLFVRWDGL